LLKFAFSNNAFSQCKISNKNPEIIKWADIYLHHLKVFPTLTKSFLPLSAYGIWRGTAELLFHF